MKIVTRFLALYAGSLAFLFIFHQLGRLIVGPTGINSLNFNQWIIFPMIHACFLVFMARWISAGPRQAEQDFKEGPVIGLIFTLHIAILMISRALIGPYDVEVSWHASIVAGIQAFGPNIQHDPWTAFMIFKRSSFLIPGPLLLTAVVVGLGTFRGRRRNEIKRIPER